jgi:D-aminopeptidase
MFQVSSQSGELSFFQTNEPLLMIGFYKGVHVGQNTVGEDGDDARKGLTVIFPRHPDSITVPCYAGMHTLNGNGEVTGSYQIKDWGFTNTV